MMAGTLIEIIDRLDEVNTSDRFASPTIFADGGPGALPSARALICPSDEEDSLDCPIDITLSYVLEVSIAREVIEVWSSWRDGRARQKQDKFEAVMYYSQHDAYLPVSDAVP